MAIYDINIDVRPVRVYPEGPMEVTAEFRSSGSLADPGTPVELRIVQPDGTEDGPFDMTKDSTGVFTYEHDIVDYSGLITIEVRENGGQRRERSVVTQPDILDFGD